jgi:hypothetical protein
VWLAFALMLTILHHPKPHTIASIASFLARKKDACHLAHEKIFAL